MKTITKVSLFIVAITVGTIFFANGIPQASNISTNDIEKKRFSDNTSIYPNPVTNKVYIVNTANASGNMFVSIIDINGRLIKQTEKPTLNSFISMEELDIGSYVMKIETSQGTAIKKFIKK